MVALQALVLSVAISGAGDTVLLEFTSTGCGPCRSMEPAIRRLESDGYPIRKINISESPMWAQHYQVRLVPCFVMVSGGREVDRIVGATSYERLVRMFEATGFDPRGATNDQAIAKSSAASTGRAVSHNPFDAGRTRDERFGNEQADTFAPTGATTFANSPPAHGASGNRLSQSNIEQQTLASTVRLTVEDPQGYSHGTGTIIDVHGNEALVLTCGHVFRDSGGKGRISVELFSPGVRGPVEGRLLHWVATSKDGDLGLVVIRPGCEVVASQVAPANYQPEPGARVFSIGCDRGANPSVRRSHITTVDRYQGPPNIEVSGMPVDGRSGGGLFTEDGMLIGVCNAAVPDDGEGIYAGLRAVQSHLALNGLKSVYERSDTAIAQRDRDALQVRPANSNPADRISSPFTPAVMHLADRDQDVEVIFIVRPKNDPDAVVQTFVLDDPSPALLEELHRQQRGQVAPSRLDPNRVAQTPAAFRQQQDGPIVRAQSADK